MLTIPAGSWWQDKRKQLSYPRSIVPTLATSFALVFAMQNTLAAKPDWPVIPPEELACKASPIDAEAPAEILEVKIEIRDSALSSRETSEYRRSKIYNPAKAEELTRYNFPSYDFEDFSFFLRLTLPDGTTKEFSDADMKERELVKHTFSSVKQKFFAIPGVVPGSIVEYKMVSNRPFGYSNSYVENFRLQQANIPVRRFDWFCRYASSDDYYFQYFLFSAPTAVATRDDKARTLRVTASNLPAIRSEPYVGPYTDFIATLCTTYDSPSANLVKSRESRLPNFRMAANNTPWGSLATGFYAIEYIHTEETRRVAKLAASICEGATTDLEKAQRVHKKVQELYTKFLQIPRRPNPNFYSTLLKGDALLVAKPEDTLDFEETSGPFISSLDFFWLAVALYRSAGLETRTLLLPDRRFVRFDPQKVAPIFLSQICAAVRIDGKWQFSYPLMVGSQYINLDYAMVLLFKRANTRVFLPFGMLPAAYEGQVGLFVQANKEEFIPIPFTAAEKNLIANVGSFKLDSEGKLTGQAMRRLTSHKASALRAELINEKPERRDDIVRKRIKGSFRGAEITIDKITGLEDPDLPVEITYTLDWPSFAIFTKDRLIIKPEVFRIEASSPFPATKRRYPINFQEPWQEIDRVVIKLPPGYAPETLGQPASQPGKPFHYRIKYAYDSSKQLFGVNRDFSSEMVEFPVEDYAQIKAWYDNVVASDHQEVVFAKSEPIPTASPAPVPADKLAPDATGTP